jgi:hypothetical protein
MGAPLKLSGCRRRAIAIALIVVVLLSTLYALLPSLTARALIDQLHRAGFADATLEVERLSPRSLVLRNIRLQQGRIRIDRIAADWSFRTLGKRRIDSLVVAGLDWEIALNEGGLDTGLPTATAPSTLPTVVPFQRLHVRNACLQMDLGHSQYEVPLDFSATASLPGDADWTLRAQWADYPIAFTGHVHLATGLRVEALQDWVSLPDWNVVQPLLPGMGAVDWAGEVRLHFRHEFNQSAAKLDIRDLHIALAEPPLTVRGLTGSIHFDRLPQIQTPSRQHLHIAHADSGVLALSDARIEFRVEDPDSLYIEQATGQMATGGHVHIQGARLHPATRQGRVDLQFEQTDVIALLARLTEENITGNGLFNGRIPISFDGGPIRLGNGYLYSAPAPGRLQIRNEEWLDLLTLYISDALGDHPYLNLAVARVQEALRDFEYHHLSIDFTEGWQGTSARIELRGKGVQGDPPQEIAALILNINDIDELLNRFLAVQETGEQHIDRVLEQWLDF